MQQLPLRPLAIALCAGLIAVATSTDALAAKKNKAAAKTKAPPESA